MIGAGIAGASVAYELAAHGSVVVLEREDVAGYHATGRSAATFNASYGHPVLRRLAAASRAFYNAPPTGFSEYPLLTPRGALLIAHRDQAHRLAEGDAALERFSPDQVCAHVPVLRREWLAGGLYDAHSQDIDVNALHQGYLRGARTRGANVVLDAKVVAITPGFVVTTSRGTFTAPIVVNAAGAWGDELATLANVTPLGLEAKRRSAFLFSGPDGVDVSRWPMVIDLEERFYFKPEGHRLLASPANQDPMPPHDVQPDELDIALGVDRLAQCSTLAVDRIHRKWAGLRTFVPRRGVVIGFAPKTPGFFWFVGQGGSGIKIAPAAARLAASLIVQREFPTDLAGLDVTPP